MKLFLLIVAGTAVGQLLGQFLIEIAGILLSWSGKMLVRLFTGAVTLIAEQRKIVAIEAARAQEEEQRKIVRE